MDFCFAFYEQVLLSAYSLTINYGFIVHVPCEVAAGYGELRITICAKPD
jgi:hypothetical protein